jgi:predicted nucleic acid-binding protein
VDAVELLGGEAPFIADTSAWWRLSSFPDDLVGLIKAAVADERLWTTPIVRMEILYSARSTSEYIALETELDALRILRNDRAVADAAISAIGELARLFRPWNDTRFRLGPPIKEHVGLAIGYEGAGGFYARARGRHPARRHTDPLTAGA